MGAGTRTYYALQEHISDSDVEHLLCAAEDTVLPRDDTLGTNIETTDKIQEKRIYNNIILWDFHLGTYIDCELQDADEDSTNLHLR